MKNELNIINTYINTASKGIKDRRIKCELKDELFSHLIEIYERNIALGLSDEDAQKDAVSHMGDSEAVAETFKKLYPVSSAEYFKDTGKMFALYLIFAMFWMHRGFVALFALSGYLLSSLDRIKNINKTIHTAYIIAKVNCLLSSLFVLVSHNIIIDNTITIAISIFLNLITVIGYIFTISGLVRVRKALNEEKTYWGLGIASIFAIATSFAIVSMQLFIEENFGLMLLAAAISLLPAGLMYTISAEDIDRLETGVPQGKKTTITRYLLFTSLGMAGVFLLFSSNIFINYSPVEYVINDTQSDVNAIRNHLVELGLPKSVADELPESEILKYSNAIEIQVNESDNTYSESYYTSYNFTLHKDDNSFIVRTLMVIENLEDFKERDYTEFFIDYYRHETEDIFCKFLCDYDGVTKELLPIKYEPIEDNDRKDLHYVFPNTRNAKNHRVYISMTVKLTPTTDTKNYFFRHKYAQTRLESINDPYEKYWTRADDWFSSKIVNPYYIETEDNNNIGFGALFEILENLPEDESIDLSELESTMEDALGQDVDSKLLENMVNQITDEVSNP